MSAEVLRQAASQMRERAEAARSTGVWHDDESDETTPADGAFTHHVATFANPVVALAVADWLDAEAAIRKYNGSLRALSSRGFRHESSQAVVVARAYLGTP